MKLQSVRAQLHFLYSAAIIGILIIATLAFYWEEQNVMDQADYSFVADEVNHIQSIIADREIDLQQLTKLVIDQPAKTYNSLYRYYIRVLDDSGNAIMATPGMEKIIGRRLPNRQRQTQYSWDIFHGEKYLTLQVPVKLKNHARDGLVQVILDTSYQHSITHDRRIFIFMLALGIMLSLLLGRLISSLSLKSLSSLTETVKKISGSSLGQRVNPNTFPAELTPLGNAFNAMLERIEQSFARLKQMSDDMSHELRTPVANLMGQTELLLSCPGSEAEQREVLASNMEELQRISTLIDNILFLARTENHHPDLSKETIVAENEVAKILDYYQLLADDKQIELTYQGAATLRANRIMFQRLLSNIISNAIKYTHHHGKVSIHIRDERDFAELHIVDNGMGIQDQHVHKLFDRFFRADSARNSETQGSGLGLAIAKSIVDLHQGTITVLSALNAGTEVIITMPK